MTLLVQIKDQDSGVNVWYCAGMLNDIA